MLAKLHLLTNHRGFIRYFKNTSWLFGEQILRLLISLVVGIWVARYLGPKQFGTMSYVLAFTSIFSGIAKLGLDGIIVREIINHPEKQDVYLGTAFWLKVVGAITVMGIISITAKFSSNNTTINSFVFIVASGTIFQSFEVIDFYFQSQVLAKFISICKIFQLIISSLVKIYLITIKAKLFWFIIVILFDAITLATALIIAYKINKKNNFYRYFDFYMAKYLLKNSWPLIFSSIVIMIYMRIDQVMIKEMLGDHYVGIYSSAVRMSEVWYIIPVIITNSIFPAILNAKRVSNDLYYQRLQSFYTFITWCAVLIIIPMIFLSDWLIYMLYGEAYREAHTVLKIHIWTSIFVFMGVSSSSWFISENLQKMAFMRTLFGAAANVILNLVLIKRYGINGAAISTLFSQFIAAYLFDIFSIKTRISFIMKTKAIIFLWK